MSAVAANGRPARGRDGAATRARIEAEALKLFAARGIDGTSVRDIALAAGVAEGALYRHFPSKELLARSLFLEGYAALAADVAAILAATPGFEARIGALVERFFRLYDDNPTAFAFLLLNQHDHLRHVGQDADGNVVKVLARMFDDAAAAGEIPPQDTALATATALGAVLQPAVFHLYGRLTGPLSDRTPAIVAAVIAGARAADRARRSAAAAGRAE
jgi:AcrR family transcriptional regulator